MSGWGIGLITLVCVFFGAIGGILLQRALPEHHLHESSKDVVKLVTGLLATLSALVLGLLIASSKSSFDALNDDFRQSAAKTIMIDRILAQYGPEAKGVRAAMRASYAAGIDRLFPERGERGAGTEALRQAAPAERIDAHLSRLAPATDAQRALKARAEQLVGEVELAHWLAFEQARSTTPAAFLIVLVTWLTAMFASFGLFAPRNGTALAALFIGALAVATALFLIEEMSRPLDGLITLSGEPMRNALAVLGE